MFAQIADGKLVISVPLNATPRECANSFVFAEASWQESDIDVTLPNGETRKLVVNMLAIGKKRAPK